MVQNEHGIVDGLVDSCSETSEPFEEMEDMDTVDPRCISQSANILLGHSKGMRGRKSNRLVREQRANEKGIVSVLNYLKVSKGENRSLGEK